MTETLRLFTLLPPPPSLANFADGDVGPFIKLFGCRFRTRDGQLTRRTSGKSNFAWAGRNPARQFSTEQNRGSQQNWRKVVKKDIDDHLATA